MRRKTNLEKAREMWERDGWGEPADDRQRDLWLAFWLGTPCDADRAWVPRNWSRPAKWIEDLVRDPAT